MAVGRQEAIRLLQDQGGATREAAVAIVDDYVATVAAETGDVAEFERLTVLFGTNPDAATAYARFGDDAFDGAGNLVDEVVEAAAVCRNGGRSAFCGLEVSAELASGVRQFELSLDSVALSRWVDTVDDVGGDEAIELLRVVSSRNAVDPAGAELIALNASVDVRLARAAVRADVVDVALTNEEYASVVSSFDRAMAAMHALRRGDLPVEIDELQDGLARLELRDIDSEALAASNSGHAFSRHGADTTLEEQYIRAVTGLTPDGVQQSFRVSASRFVSNELQLEAIERARTEFLRSGENLQIVEFDSIVGEGFSRFGQSYQQGRFVRVVFNNDGTVLTAFPDLGDFGFDVYPVAGLLPGVQ